MLQIHIVRDQRDNVIRGLKKRRLKDAEVLVDKALALDQKRKDTQRRNDEVLQYTGKRHRQPDEIGAKRKG